MKTPLPALLVLLLALLVLQGACRSEDTGSSTDKTTVTEQDRSGTGTVSTDTSGVRSVDDGSRPSTRRLTSIDDRVVRGNTAFGFELLDRTCGSGEHENVFISPLSVSIALAMTATGASGTTAEAMADVLGFANIEPAELNQTMSDLQTALERADPEVQLTVANSLWGHKDVRFNDDFFETNRRFYGAEVSALDFRSPNALATINGWVSKETNDLIRQILDRIPPAAVLYLINAIYFKGQWMVEFDPARTESSPFHLHEGDETSVPMMNQSGSYRYAEDAAVQAVRLPYGKDRLAMYVFLPRPQQSLDGFVGGLDEGTWTEWIARLRPREGDVRLPRFKIEYECVLNDALDAMGMGVAFEAGQADFSRMLADPEASKTLFISMVKHKAVVDVNEEGTEAAAVTAVQIERTTAIGSQEERFKFVADRPFFFAIRDDLTGSIVFMGAVYDPSS